MAHDPNDIPKEEPKLVDLPYEKIKKNFESAVQSSELPQESQSSLFGLSGLMLGGIAGVIIVMVALIGMKAVRESFPKKAKDNDEATYHFMEVLGLFILAFVAVLIFIFLVTIV